MKDLLMGKAAKLSYLQLGMIDVDAVQEVDKQIKEATYQVLEEIEFGFADPKQEDKLRSNSGTISNALCFIQRHWKVLMRAEFPRIPDSSHDTFSQSKMLQAIAGVIRSKPNE